MKTWTRVALFGAMAFSFAAAGFAADQPKSVSAEISEQALLPSEGPQGRPLPVAAAWNCSGFRDEGFCPAYMIPLVEQGHFVLPSFNQPESDISLAQNFKDRAAREKRIQDMLKAYEPAIRKVAEMKIPIVFLGTQWESMMYYDKRYLDLPQGDNPNVVAVTGEIRPSMSPFGAIGPWRQCGREWTDSAILRKIQEWYPDPPMVIFVSNNEGGKLTWDQVETCRAYMKKYGPGRSDDFKRQVVADGFVDRFRVLLDGMRESLVSPVWKKNTIFVAYEASGPPHLGHPMNPPEFWKLYSHYSPGRLDIGPLIWDGSSPSYYLHNWMPITDYTVWSPQVESMNWAFMNEEAYKLNPHFWFELSTWDGDEPGLGNAKRLFYAQHDEDFNPGRYGGFIQFGMWLLRPRAVREFRGYLETVDYDGQWFDPIVAACDRVHKDPVLRDFWRFGELVPNTAHEHPYQVDIPEEFKKFNRWFMLDTSLDPKRPWTLLPTIPPDYKDADPTVTPVNNSLQTKLPVFALALVKGKAPEREWLVYANAPERARPGVTLTVPDFGPITVDVPQDGAYFLVSEKTRKATTVCSGGPASVTIATPSRFVDAGQAVLFSIQDAYSPSGKLTRFAWDFGDGAADKGEKVTHAFAKPGQYLVKLTGDEAASATVPVFVGLKPEKDLVLRYVMARPPATVIRQMEWEGGWHDFHYHLMYDSSGAGNMGFITGETWSDDPARGAVPTLKEKESHIELVSDPSINSGGPYANRTISLWFKADDVTKRQVLYKEGGPGAGFDLYLDKGNLYGGAWATETWPGTWLSTPASPGQWHHVALVLDNAGDSAAADKLSLYADGKKVGSGQASQIPGHTGNINFGRNNGGTLYHDKTAGANGEFYTGSYGGMWIYNRALSAPEIAAQAQQ